MNLQQLRLMAVTLSVPSLWLSGGPLAAALQTAPAAEAPAKPVATQAAPAQAPTAEAPAAAPAATPVPATATPVPAADDYTQLARPEAAAATGLTAEQQASVQQLLAERAAAIAAAPEADRPGIAATFNARLQNVLTADQQRLFRTLLTGKTLRFNFRYQKWAEVLDWVSKEADLSLVMDTPPPGTFHYADSKDYTTTEAIDLLNGWLLTKGFTLVRRERMLMCLDLKGGLPEGAIPRITTAELALRGRYEFVSVLLPLEGRPAEAVLLEVKPLLGTWGKAEPLAQTQQLLVTDTASNLRVIEQVVGKIPVPTAPAAAPAPPQPVLTIYPIRHANPAQAAEILKQIIPGSVVVDDKAGQIAVNAIPADQEKAKAILSQLEANQGPDTAPVLQLYPLQTADAEQLLATLRLISPTGQHRVDPVTGKVVVWASAQDQERISAALQTLQADLPAGGGPQLQVYALQKAEPTAVSTILATLVPQARLTINTTTRSLIAIGSLSDHQAIRALLEQLEAQPDAATANRELRTYSVSPSVSATAVTLLSTAIPRAQVLADTTNQRLLIMATPEDHAQLDLLLKSLAAAQDQGRQLQIHSAENIDTTSVVSLLATLVPQASVTVDSAHQRLLVLASAQDQAAIARVLEQVQVDVASTVRTLKAYPLAPKTASATAVSLLSSLLPKASALADEANRRLLVTATDNEHALVEQILQQVQQAATGVLPELQFYPLQNAATSGAATVTVLQSVAPTARITLQPEAGRLSVIATPDDHATIARTLETMAAGAPAVQRDLKFYDVADIGATDARTLLTSTFTDVSFVPTAEGTKLMAWVSAEQDARIRATLEQLAAERPFDAARTLELYSITDLGPSASTVLAQAAPRASISAGARADQLAIVATAAEHKTLQDVLARLQQSRAPKATRELTVYPIRGIAPASVLQVLQPLVDADVQLTIDPTGQQLFVRATAEKQQQLRTVIEQVTNTLAERGARTTKTYLIGAPNADEAQEVLSALYPDARIVTDADRKLIVATALPEQHVTIEQIAREMQGSSLEEERPAPAVYSLQHASAQEVQSLLQSLYSRFDNVRLSVNEQTGRLVVVARKEQQEAIRQLIEQLDDSSDAARQRELAVFRLNNQDGIAVQLALQPLLPKGAQVTADRINRQLFVSAMSSQMPAIRAMVEQMLQAPPTGQGLQTRTYRLRPYEADEVQQALLRLFPDATLVTDSQQEVLLATATPQQHETIGEVVQQMLSTTPNEQSRQVRTYPLRTADGENAADVLDALFRRSDNVQLSFDERTRSLIAVARPDQQTIISQLVQELEASAGSTAERTLEIYSWPGTDGLTAVEAIKDVLQATDPSAVVSWDRLSKQLLVSTTAAGQQQVRSAVERFRSGDDREMDVIQLRTLSATSAQNAIEGLFGDRFSSDSSYPVIQADEDTQQLLIRGSQKQIQDIRLLLTRMGEPGIAVGGTEADAAARHLRVITVPGDPEPMLRRIQDLWPQLRPNPLRVLRPDGGGGIRDQLSPDSSLQPHKADQHTPNATPPAQPADQPPADPLPQAAPPATGQAQFSVAPEALSPATSPSPTESQSAADNAQPDQSQPDSASQLNTPTPDAPSSADQPPGSQPVDQPAAGAAPVVIVPGSGRITIASDDTAALDQLEAILRAATAPVAGTGGSRHRDFAVYQLRNAGAEDVARTLSEVYESRAGTLAFGSVVLVPEPRMNALIVYGGRTDRDRIEQLLEILDSEKLPDSGRIFRTQVIPVQHADAQQVERVLSGVYRTEMSAGGARRPIDIPAGIDSSVASVLRQINAAASSPLLTIEVQRETNSLVVKAPQNLIDELTELVQQLDATSQTSRARGVTLIPLQKTNTRRVMRILDDVLDQ